MYRNKLFKPIMMIFFLIVLFSSLWQISCGSSDSCKPKCQGVEKCISGECVAPRWISFNPMGDNPKARKWHSMVYDNIHQRMILFGGQFQDEKDQSLDLWAVNLEAKPKSWLKVDPEEDTANADQKNPKNRFLHSALFDSSKIQMLFFGGFNDIDDGTDLDDLKDNSLDSSWALQLHSGGDGKWKRLFPAGQPPQFKRSHGAVYDQENQVALFLGQEKDDNECKVFFLDTSEDTLKWQEIFPGGQRPKDIQIGTIAYDSHGKKMYLYGGKKTSGSELYADLWSLTITKDNNDQWDGDWKKVVIDSPITPKKRQGHSLVYDSKNQTLVLFGGINQKEETLNDLWALSLTNEPKTWLKITSMGEGPGGRYGHRAIYDPIHRRMVLFGGNHEDTLLWFLQLPEDLTSYQQ